MTLLIDTHAFLWWRENSRRLTAAARQALRDADVVWVSAASGWEVAVKQQLGKLRLDQPFAGMVTDSAFTELAVTLAHAEHLTALPRHHRDPFDRMLIAQARVEGATLVSHDRAFEPYGVPMIWT